MNTEKWIMNNIVGEMQKMATRIPFYVFTYNEKWKMDVHDPFFTFHLLGKVELTLLH